MADASDAESPLLETFVDAFSAKLWKDCCEAAHRCCQLMISKHNGNSVENLITNS
jgi:hypothetical protein